MTALTLDVDGLSIAADFIQAEHDRHSAAAAFPPDLKKYYHVHHVLRSTQHAAPR